MFNLYNFIIQKLIWKMISAYSLWFDNWIFQEWKTEKNIESFCLSILTIWLVHLNFDMFTAAMFIFFCKTPKYVQA